MKNILAVLMFAWLALGCLNPCAAEWIETNLVFQPPSDDQWQYPYNATPGEKEKGVVFWNDASTYEEFNRRDGVAILAWDTTAQILPGMPLEAYAVSGCTVTVWNTAQANWVLEGLNNNGVPVAVELFGVGFDSIEPEDWQESSSIVAGRVPGPIPPTPRDPYPIDLLTGDHAEDATNAVAWSSGLPLEYTPGAMTESFPIRFVLDVEHPRVREYLSDNLHRGRVFFTVTSTMDASITYGAGSTGDSPEIIFKEGVVNHPGAQAPRLEILLMTMGASSIDNWFLYQ